MSELLRCWYALVVKSRCEFKAEEELHSINVETYLPATVSIRKWSDRKKEIKLPLIKGYIFICATETERLYSLEQNSVVKCLFDGGRAAVIPDWQIENLKRVLEYNPKVTVESGLVKGDLVKIIEGPFKDVVGVLNSDENERSIRVSIDLINRSVIVNLPPESIIKAVE